MGSCLIPLLIALLSLIVVAILLPRACTAEVARWAMLPPALPTLLPVTEAMKSAPVFLLLAALPLAFAALPDAKTYCAASTSSAGEGGGRWLAAGQAGLQPPCLSMLGGSAGRQGGQSGR